MRVGQGQGSIAATTRKLAVLVYRKLASTFVYHDSGTDAYQQLSRTG